MPPRKQPWFRLYVEMIWDRKVRRLKVAHRWLWVVLLACAKSSPTPGVLLLTDNTPMTEDDIADAAAMKPGDVSAGIGVLATLGLIDVDRNVDAWCIPRWNERQFESDTSTDRTEKHRSNERSSNGDVTPPETEADTESETDTEKSLSRARRNFEASKWRPTSELIEWAASEFPSVDLVVETEKFMDHFLANGKPMKDWNAAWRNWIRRSVEFQVSR